MYSYKNAKVLLISADKDDMSAPANSRPGIWLGPGCQEQADLSSPITLRQAISLTKQWLKNRQQIW